MGLRITQYQNIKQTIRKQQDKVLYMYTSTILTHAICTIKIYFDWCMYFINISCSTHRVSLSKMGLKKTNTNLFYVNSLMKHCVTYTVYAFVDDCTHHFVHYLYTLLLVSARFT